MNKEFMYESIDLKRMALLFRKKLGLIILAAACGAIVGGGIYLLFREAAMETKWQAQSQFHMRFIFDPTDGVEQSYNGYSWNDLLHGDPVVERIVAAIQNSDDERWSERDLLGEDRIALCKELVRAALKGEIISDTRLLTVTAAAAEPDMAEMLRNVIEAGLLEYAGEQAEIVSFKLIRSTGPTRVIWDDRMPQAAVGGGVLFLVIALLGWWFVYILDDSLYVLADGEKRYPFPVLGMLVGSDGSSGPLRSGNKDRPQALGNMGGRQPYGEELAENVAHLLDNEHKLAFISVDELLFAHDDEAANKLVNEATNETTNKTTNEATNETTNETTNEATNEATNKATNEARDKKALKSAAAAGDGAAGTKNIFDRLMKEKVSSQSWETTAVRAWPAAGLGAMLRGMDGVILAVPFGRRNGRKLEHWISFLRNQDCKILGIIITEGDRLFWRLYYGGKVGRK